MWLHKSDEQKRCAKDDDQQKHHRGKGIGIFEKHQLIKGILHQKQKSLTHLHVHCRVRQK